MATTYHRFLEDAFQRVADATFYAPLVITPKGDGYLVEDSSHFGEDGVMWTYEDGLEVEHLNLAAHTRLMDPFERFSTGEQVRKHLGEGIAQRLIDGEVFEFGYLTVDAYPEHPEGEDWRDCTCGDTLAGWILAVKAVR